MLKLYVMRHAKSSWAVPGAGDFERELSDRGRSDLQLVSAEIKKRGITPDKILCSPSIRTRQTYDGISEAFTPQTEVEYIDTLYSGGLEDYLSAIRAQKNNETIMTIGHNPMSGSLASSLSGDGDLAAMEKIAFKYPTATIALFEFDLDGWASIERGSGKLTGCIFPSELS